MRSLLWCLLRLVVALRRGLILLLLISALLTIVLLRRHLLATVLLSAVSLTVVVPVSAALIVAIISVSALLVRQELDILRHNLCGVDLLAILVDVGTRLDSSLDACLASF